MPAPSNYWEHRTFLAERALTEALRVMITALPHAARAFESVSHEWKNNVDGLSDIYYPVKPAMDVLSVTGTEAGLVSPVAEEEKPEDIAATLARTIEKVRMAQQQSSDYKVISRIIGDIVGPIDMQISDFNGVPEASDRVAGIYSSIGEIAEGYTTNNNLLLIDCGITWLLIELTFNPDRPVGMVFHALRDYPFTLWDGADACQLPVHLLEESVLKYLAIRNASFSLIDPVVASVASVDLTEHLGPDHVHSKKEEPSETPTDIQSLPEGNSHGPEPDYPT